MGPQASCQRRVRPETESALPRPTAAQHYQPASLGALSTAVASRPVLYSQVQEVKYVPLADLIQFCLYGGTLNPGGRSAMLAGGLTRS